MSRHVVCWEGLDAALWQRLLGRPVSEHRRLCHGDGATRGAGAAGGR